MAGVKPQSGPIQKQATEGFQFGDPDSYKGMTDAEKDALTKKMMSSHRRWANEV